MRTRSLLHMRKLTIARIDMHCSDNLAAWACS